MVPRKLKEIGADVFISPDMMLSLRAQCPQLVVLHDLNFEHYPQDLPWLVSRYFRFFFPKFARKAKRILTVSHFSKADIVQTYGISNNKISVVYNGISDEFRAEYAEKSPDAPETLVAKIVKMNEIWKKEPNINLAEIAKISVPTLVLAGDDDVVIHSHSIELFEALPLGQLAIVPGTSHALVKEKPELVATLINSFLSDQSYPITRYPIRRNNPT
jgi:pimeloyl-ACP methyl ester carboxylesterase